VALACCYWCVWLRGDERELRHNCTKQPWFEFEKIDKFSHHSCLSQLQWWQIFFQLRNQLRILTAALKNKNTKQKQNKNKNKNKKCSQRIHVPSTSLSRGQSAEEAAVDGLSCRGSQPGSLCADSC
jgi:predicted component of type VI protein secretion system